jgi:hypothetical protein
LQMGFLQMGFLQMGFLQMGFLQTAPDCARRRWRAAWAQSRGGEDQARVDSSPSPS